MKITAYWLRKHGACPDQIRIFKEEWPEGGEITWAHLERALELGLNLEWLYVQLSYDCYHDNEAVRAEYAQAKFTAWEAYSQAMRSAEATCRQTITEDPQAIETSQEVYIQAKKETEAAYAHALSAAFIQVILATASEEGKGRPAMKKQQESIDAYISSLRSTHKRAYAIEYAQCVRSGSVLPPLIAPLSSTAARAVRVSIDSILTEEKEDRLMATLQIGE